MRRLLVFVVLLFNFTVACVPFHRGGIYDFPHVSGKETAGLVIITEKSFRSQGMGFIPVINGVEVCVLDQNQYAVIPVTPGEHAITGKIAARQPQTTEESSIKISQKVGETLYLFFVLQQPSFEMAYVVVTQIPEEQAHQLMKDAIRVGAEQALQHALPQE